MSDDESTPETIRIQDLAVDEIRELLGINPELPKSMKDIDAKSGRPVQMPADYGKLKAYLCDFPSPRLAGVCEARPCRPPSSRSAGAGRGSRTAP